MAGGSAEEKTIRGRPKEEEGDRLRDEREEGEAASPGRRLRDPRRLPSPPLARPRTDRRSEEEEEEDDRREEAAEQSRPRHFEPARARARGSSDEEEGPRKDVQLEVQGERLLLGPPPRPAPALERSPRPLAGLPRFRRRPGAGE